MRGLFLFLCLAIAAPVAAQQVGDKPGFFDRLFGTDTADSDAEQGSMLEWLIEDSLSGAGRTVSVEGFEGALSGRATLDSLTIADASGVWLTLEEAVLDWNRGALFSGRLEVAELTAARIDLPRWPRAESADAPTPEASGFALPELPVSIEIGRIAAEDVELGAPILGVEAQVAVDGSLSLATGAGNAELTIDRRDAIGSFALAAAFDNATEVLKLDLSLREAEDGIFANLVGLPGVPPVEFSIKGEAPLAEFAAGIRMATDGAERLSGQVAIREAEDTSRRIVARIGGDIAPIFAPDYRPFFGENIGLEAEALIAPDGAITVPQLALRAQSIALEGTLDIGADRLPRKISLTGEVSSGDGSPVLLPIAGAETRIDRADLVIGFDADVSDDWTGDIRIIGLDRDRLSAGQLALVGTGRIVPGASSAVTAALRFDARQLETGIDGMTEALGSDITGEAGIAWQDGPIVIDGLRITGNALTARGAGEVSLAESGPKVVGSIALAARRLSDFSILAGRSLSGAADLEAKFQVRPLAGTFDVRADGQTTNLSVDEPRVDSVVAGRAELDLQVTRDEDGLRVDINRLASDMAELTAIADLKSGGSVVTLEGDLKDTSVLLRQLEGPSRITFNGREDMARNWDVQADLMAPSFAASVDGKVGDLYDLPAFEGEISASADDLSDFAELAGRPLEGRFTLHANGLVNSDLSRAALVANVNGANLSIGQAEADRLLAGALTARVDACRDGDVIEVREFDLATPMLSLNANGALAEGGSELAVRANLSDLAPFAAGFQGPLDVTGTVAQSGSALLLDLDATGPGGSRAQLDGSLEEDLSRADLSASGTAPLGLANRFITPRALSGTAGFDLRLVGALALQNVTGRVATSSARLVDPELGMALSDISGNATLGGGAVQLTLQSSVEGGGRVGVDGTVGMSPPNGSNLAVTLRNIKLSDPSLYETTADGTVHVNGPLGGGGSISGAISLGQTDIRIPDSGFGGVGAVPEIIHLNEPPQVRSTRRRAGLLDRKRGEGSSGAVFPLDIQIAAPSRIFVRGRGLDSEFGGDLRLAGTTADVVPIGAFELIRGRLDILGRRLQLEEARITMQGSLVPVIRLRASTDAEEYRVNVDIAGPVDNPEITFSSSPELPQEEVLARLIFGRGLETLSPLQAARLALAVRTLAGQGGEGVIGRIRGRTGLADLDVTTSDEGEAAVRAGAYLGENIYTDVTVDSAGETELNLNLDITPSLTAKGGATNSGDTSIGIFFERDY